MKRYLLLLISILLLCVTLVACDPTTPDVPTDTTVESVTNAPTEAPTETLPEETTEKVTTEAPTEPERGVHLPSCRFYRRSWCSSAHNSKRKHRFQRKVRNYRRRKTLESR